jgi:hypothetical protein
MVAFEATQGACSAQGTPRHTGMPVYVREGSVEEAAKKPRLQEISKDLVAELLGL